MPSIMFKHDEISTLLAHIKKYDFVTQRTKSFDNIITRFNTTDNVEEVFRDYISNNSAIQHILSNNINEICSDNTKKGKDYRRELLYYFARMCKLAPKSDSLSTVNCEFDEFVKDLFYFTQRNLKKLKLLFITLKRCVYAWNGGGNDHINLKNDIEGYIVSAELDLEIDRSIFSQNLADTSFEKFPAYINVTLMDKKHHENKAILSIDYDLYKMLKLVENGYRPSAKDNNKFVGFLSFINRLSEYSAHSEEVFIECLKHDNRKKYKLIKDAIFGYSFMEV